MRIAMIGAKGIPFPGEGGGIERHVEELAARLVNIGEQVAVYVRPRAVKERGEWKGVRLVALPSIATKHLDTISHVFLSTLHALFQNYDIIHYHGVGPSTLAWIPRVFARRTKVVVTFHSQDRFHKKWGLIARLYLTFGEWTAVRFPHATIVVSHALEVYCRKRFGAKAIYIPNGVEIKAAPPERLLREFGLEPRQYILTVARLIRHKGIHLLVEAFRELQSELKLVVVGAPSYTEDYRQYLLELSRRDQRVKFVGFQSGEALGALYAHAAFYVHASETEGLSLSILEAMSYGVPVLISDIPENLETIDHSGFSFLSGSTDDLREKLEALLARGARRDRVGERGREFVRRNFAWGTIAQKTLELYRRLRVDSQPANR